MSEFVYKTKLFEDVAGLIIEHIRNNIWQAGERLPAETDLAKLFDVSRSTVRLAIKSLQVSGLLYSRAGAGTYVADNALLILATRELATVMADPENVGDLVQARFLLEPQMAALAAQKATAAEIDELLDVVRHMEQTRDKILLMSFGYRFHQILAKASHNPVLYGFYQSAAKQLQGLRLLESLSIEVFLEGTDEHRCIVQAIAKRDPSLAKQQMELHLKKDYAAYL